MKTDATATFFEARNEKEMKRLKLAITLLFAVDLIQMLLIIKK